MAYKVFTNGSPLPASDLNTFLMNQSVIVFSNSTARSAALTAPTEGMVTYLEDTNKLEVYTGAAWVDVNDNAAAIPKSTVTTAGDLIVGNGNASVTRLGIGTNGQVLSSNGTTATWTTPQTPDSVITTQGDLIIGNSSGDAARLGIGSNGQLLRSDGTTASWATVTSPPSFNWNLISTNTITNGVATYSVSNITAYDNYFVLFDNVSGNDAAAQFNVTLSRAGTGTNTTKAIEWRSSLDYIQIVAGSSFFLGGHQTSAANQVSGYMTVNNATGASPAVVTCVAGNNDYTRYSYHHVGWGRVSSTGGQINRITIATNNGTFDSGTITIYGV